MEEKITPWNDFHMSCRMNLKDFIKDVKDEVFRDWDGYGVYATEEGYMGNVNGEFILFVSDEEYRDYLADLED